MQSRKDTPSCSSTLKRYLIRPKMRLLEEAPAETPSSLGVPQHTGGGNVPHQYLDLPSTLVGKYTNSRILRSCAKEWPTTGMHGTQ